jgi:hypothetical protein
MMNGAAYLPDENTWTMTWGSTDDLRDAARILGYDPDEMSDTEVIRNLEQVYNLDMRVAGRDNLEAPTWSDLSPRQRWEFINEGSVSFVGDEQRGNQTWTRDEVLYSSRRYEDETVPDWAYTVPQSTDARPSGDTQGEDPYEIGYYEQLVAASSGAQQEQAQRDLERARQQLRDDQAAWDEEFGESHYRNGTVRLSAVLPDGPEDERAARNRASGVTQAGDAVDDARAARTGAADEPEDSDVETPDSDEETPEPPEVQDEAPVQPQTPPLGSNLARATIVYNTTLRLAQGDMDTRAVNAMVDRLESAYPGITEEIFGEGGVESYIQNPTEVEEQTAERVREAPPMPPNPAAEDALEIPEPPNGFDTRGRMRPPAGTELELDGTTYRFLGRMWAQVKEDGTLGSTGQVETELQGQLTDTWQTSITQSPDQPDAPDTRDSEFDAGTTDTGISTREPPAPPSDVQLDEPPQVDDELPPPPEAPEVDDESPTQPDAPEVDDSEFDTDTSVDPSITVRDPDTLVSPGIDDELPDVDDEVPDEPEVDDEAPVQPDEPEVDDSEFDAEPADDVEVDNEPPAEPEEPELDTDVTIPDDEPEAASSDPGEIEVDDEGPVQPETPEVDDEVGIDTRDPDVAVARTGPPELRSPELTDIELDTDRSPVPPQVDDQGPTQPDAPETTDSEVEVEPADDREIDSETPPMPSQPELDAAPEQPAGAPELPPLDDTEQDTETQPQDAEDAVDTEVGDDSTVDDTQQDDDVRDAEDALDPATLSTQAQTATLPTTTTVLDPRINTRTTGQTDTQTDQSRTPRPGASLPGADKKKSAYDWTPIQLSDPLDLQRSRRFNPSLYKS